MREKTVSWLWAEYLCPVLSCDGAFNPESVVDRGDRIAALGLGARGHLRSIRARIRALLSNAGLVHLVNHLR